MSSTWFVGFTILVLAVAGCASIVHTLPEYEGLQVLVGSELPLHEEASWNWRWIAAKTDESGRVHLLVAPAQHQPSYLLIGKEGVLKRMQLPTPPKDGITQLDIAIEPAGIVHALINDEHLVLDKDDWRSVGRVPCEQIAVAGNKLVCAFKVSGEEVNAPGRWDIFGFGGIGVGIIIPLKSVGPKLVLTGYAEGRWTPWLVLDPEIQDAVDTFSIAADERGRIHVLYYGYKSRIHLGTTRGGTLRYARISTDAIQREAVRGMGARPFSKVESLLIDPPEAPWRQGDNKRFLMDPPEHMYQVGEKPHFSVDPKTGDAMVVDNAGRSYQVHQEAISRFLLSDRPRELNIWAVTAAGQSRYHALVLEDSSHLRLLFWDGRRWAASVSVPASISFSSALFHTPGTAVGNGAGDVFLVSLNRGSKSGIFDPPAKLVGRWIKFGF